MTKARLAALAATLLAMPLPVTAHQVWLEREGGTVRAYFGEPVEGTRERSGGLLDRIPGPRIFIEDPSKPLPLRRETDHIQASLPAADSDVRLVEDSLAPYGRVPEQRTRPSC
ncbi:hypothetical protein [Belnapia moabensis]|uniref:hypothetical protein n=1 Tax=Belnapia moabensis TaxID=365533 RepID=UPI0005BE023A|nr:hypothetical protein [Belnapia moabensis]